MHCLWVTEWAIIEEILFLCNKHRCWWSLIKKFICVIEVTFQLLLMCSISMDIIIFYLKYYANLSWVCSVGTCIVNVLILD